MAAEEQDERCTPDNRVKESNQGRGDGKREKAGEKQRQDLATACSSVFLRQNPGGNAGRGAECDPHRRPNHYCCPAGTARASRIYSGFRVDSVQERRGERETCPPPRPASAHHQE